MLTGIFNFNKLLFAFKILVVLLAFTFLAEIYAKILALQKGNNNLIYHLNVPVQYSIYTVIFYVLSVNKLQRNFAILSAAFLLLFAIINSGFVQSLLQFPTYSLLVESLLILGNVLLVFKNMLSRPTDTPLVSQGVFWFSLGTFIFYGFTFFYWGFFQFFLQNNELANVLLLIPYSANLLMYSCYFAALYVEIKRFKNTNLL